MFMFSGVITRIWILSKEGEFNIQLLFSALVANLANTAVLLYVGYILGNSFFHYHNTRNSLKTTL